MAEGKPRHTWLAMLTLAGCLTVAIAVVLPPALDAQQGRGRGSQPPPPLTLGLDGGTLEFDIPAFTLRLVEASQTIAALEPKGVPTYTPTPRTGRGRGGRRGGGPPQPTGPLDFDFTPADRRGLRRR